MESPNFSDPNNVHEFILSRGSIVSAVKEVCRHYLAEDIKIFLAHIDAQILLDNKDDILQYAHEHLCENNEHPITWNDCTDIKRFIESAIDKNNKNSGG